MHVAHPRARPHTRAPSGPGTFRSGRTTSASWMLPLLLGMCYGSYIGFMDHNNGSSRTNAVVFGLICCGAASVVAYLLGRVGRGMSEEGHAIAYGTAFGCAFGLLYSLSNSSILKSSLMGLLLGVIMAICVFYVVHTRSD